MKKFSAALLALSAIIAPLPASAAIVFTEDFNDLGFEGSYLADNTSDRFGASKFYQINNYNGWTFSGSTPFYVRNANAPDGALQLNETTATASRTLTGLTAGTTYLVSLLLSGDNIPGSDYSFSALVDGLSIIAVTGTDGTSGSNPGRVVSGSFVATSSSASFGLSQSPSLSSASPVIDNISVSSIPEPVTWGMMILGFGMIGGMLRRQRTSTTFA